MERTERALRSQQPARLLDPSGQRPSWRTPAPRRSPQQLLLHRLPLAAGASRIPRDGRNGRGHPQGHLAANTHRTCQQRVSPNERLHGPRRPKLLNKRPRVLSPLPTPHPSAAKLPPRSRCCPIPSPAAAGPPCRRPARLASAASCGLPGEPRPAGQPWIAATEPPHSSRGG